MTLHHRLLMGWDPEAAISIAPGARGVGRKPTISYTIDGMTRTFQEWLSMSHVKRTTAEARIKRGLSPAEAMELTTNKGRR
jgi:hypothetical protein